jgi:hypothetical protein
MTISDPNPYLTPDPADDNGELIGQTEGTRTYARKNDDVLQSAILSKDGFYRYRLERRWGEGKPLVFLMLNPSTANAMVNDLTITKCIGYAKRWNYPAIVVVNLYAYRSTYPGALAAVPDPIGPENDRHILDACAEAGRVVIAWGRANPRRVGEVMRMLKTYGYPIYAIRQNVDGNPAHPSRAGYTSEPITYEDPRT